MLALIRSAVIGPLALPLCVGAQFTVYTTSNSDITDDFVTGLAPSANGVWVATVEGLNHFDGLAWSNWTTGNSNLPAAVVTDLAVDGNGQLWIWNFDQGCSRFNGASFEQFTMADGLGSNLGSNVMLLNNNMCAGTYGGLSAFSGSVFSTTNIDDGLPNNDVRDCDVDGTGGIWIPTFGGGIAYYFSVWTIYDSGNSDLPHDEVFVARVHENGHVWIGTRDGLVDFDAGEFTVYNMDNSIMADNDVRNIEFGNDGEVVVCTRHGGVYTIDAVGNWAAYTTGNSNLPSDETWESLVDEDGNLWVATSSGLATIAGWSSPTVIAQATAFADAQVNVHNGWLQVSIPEGAAQVRLTDELGRSLWDSGSPVAGVQRRMPGVTAGVYHVALRNDQGQRVWKVMVE